LKLRAAIAVAWMTLILWAPDLAFAKRAPDEYAHIRTVAVVSALGNIPMRGGGEHGWRQRADVTIPGDWAIDDFVTTLVADALRYRFQVLRVPSGPGAARDLLAALALSPFDGFQERVKAKPLALSVDAYIVVYPVTVEVSGEQWEGLALTHSGGLFRRGRTFASAAYAVAVYDARTGGRIGYGTARSPDAGPPPALLTVETCDNEIWASRPDKLTPAQQLEINDAFRALIARSLPAALQDAGLIGGGNARIRTDFLEGRPLACRPY